MYLSQVEELLGYQGGLADEFKGYKNAYSLTIVPNYKGHTRSDIEDIYISILTKTGKTWYPSIHGCYELKKDLTLHFHTLFYTRRKINFKYVNDQLRKYTLGFSIHFDLIPTIEDHKKWVSYIYKTANHGISQEEVLATHASDTEFLFIAESDDEDSPTPPYKGGERSKTLLPPLDVSVSDTRSPLYTRNEYDGTWKQL